MKHVLMLLLIISSGTRAWSITRPVAHPITPSPLITASLGATAAPQDARPPLSKDEVLDLLMSSTPHKKIISTIKQYGIAFEPVASVLNEFRKKGADNELIAALQKEWRQEIPKPLSDKDILVMVAENKPSEAIIQSVNAQGLNFQPTSSYLAWLRSQGAKDMLLEALRGMSPRPFSKAELLQSLPARKDSERLTQEVQERGIDFEPEYDCLQTLRTAGARETLLKAVREAKRGSPFVPPKRNNPLGLNLTSAMVSAPLVEGKEASLICSPADSGVPVFTVPNDLGSVATVLRCGDKVTFLEKVAVPPGIDKIRYGGGKEGYTSNAYLESSIANVAAPTAISKPEAPYTPEARRDKVEGNVTLWIVVDSQGSVSSVQENSKPLGYGLDESAINTVKKWKFKPATRYGVPVEVRVAVEISFRLHNQP